MVKAALSLFLKKERLLSLLSFTPSAVPGTQ